MLLLRKRASTRMKRKKLTNLDSLYANYYKYNIHIKLSLFKKVFEFTFLWFLLVIVFAIWFVLSFTMPCLVIIILF